MIEATRIAVQTFSPSYKHITEDGDSHFFEFCTVLGAPILVSARVSSQLFSVTCHLGKLNNELIEEAGLLLFLLNVNSDLVSARVSIDREDNAWLVSRRYPGEITASEATDILSEVAIKADSLYHIIQGRIENT